MKRLIINADDFGYDETTTDAILQTHLEGIVLNTSVLTNLPCFKYAISKLRQYPTLSAGVHLNFTHGKPVLSAHGVGSLIDENGYFHSELEFPKWLHKIQPQELEREFRAQITKFVDAGVRPTHLDNHRFEIYLSPLLFGIVVKLASEYNIPLRMPLDDSLASKASTYARKAGVSEEVVLTIGRKYQEMFSLNNIRKTNYFYEIDETLRSPPAFVSFLESLPSGVSEICSHPGHRDDRQRAESFLWRCSLIRDAVSRLDIKISSYGELFGS